LCQMCTTTIMNMPQLETLKCSGFPNSRKVRVTNEVDALCSWVRSMAFAASTHRRVQQLYTGYGRNTVCVLSVGCWAASACSSSRTAGRRQGAIHQRDSAGGSGAGPVPSRARQRHHPRSMQLQAPWCILHCMLRGRSELHWVLGRQRS
jgi:hypothetical protein